MSANLSKPTDLSRRDSAVAQGNLTGIAFAEIQAQPPAQGSGST